MSFCIELFCVVTLQYQILVRIAIAYFIIEKKKSAPQPWQAIAQRFCSIGTYENGVFKEPITYVLKETATLKGYEKTEEEWEIVFTYQNDKTPVIEVVKEIQNKKIPETPGTVKPGPKTGDDTNWFLPLLTLGVSAGMVAGLLYYRKRHKKA